MSTCHHMSTYGYHNLLYGSNLLPIREVGLWDLLSFSKLDITVKNNSIFNTKLTETEISYKAGRTPSFFTFLLVHTTNSCNPNQQSLPLPQPMNQFRFNEGPQTQWDNVKLSTDHLCYPPLTTITSISYNTITRPYIPWETSRVFFSGAIFIPNLQHFCAIHGPFHPNAEI